MMCQNMEVAMSGNKEGEDVAAEGKLDKLLVWRDLKCIIHGRKPVSRKYIITSQ